MISDSSCDDMARLKTLHERVDFKTLLQCSNSFNVWFPMALPAEMTTLSYSLVKSESEKSRADPTARFAGPYNGSHLREGRRRTRVPEVRDGNQEVQPTFDTHTNTNTIINTSTPCQVSHTTAWMSWKQW